MKSMKGLGYVFIVALLMLSEAYSVTPEEQQRFADGLYTRKLHEMAIKEYNRIIEEHPSYPQNDIVLYRAGECARRLGQAEQAMAYYKQITEVFPQSVLVPKTLLRQSEMHVQRGEFGNAIVLLKKLEGLKSEKAIAAAGMYYQGLSYSKLQQFDKGHAIYDALIKAHPDSPYSGYAALEKARHLGTKNEGAPSDELIALFKQAAEKPPSERAGAEAQLSLADQYYRMGKFAESSDAFTKLFATYGNYDSTKAASLNAAWAHYNAKKHQVCLDLVARTEAGLRVGKESDWMYLEANCLRHLKRDAEALKKYQALVVAHAGSTYADFAGYEIALISFANEDFDQVLKQATRMLAQPKLKEDGLWLIAESYRALKKVDDAISHYQQIVREFPPSPRAPESTYHAAQLLQGQKKHAAAAVEFRAVAMKYPKHELAPRGLFAAGFCAGLENDFAQAAKDWGQLAATYADHDLVNESLYQKGLAEMQLKQEAVAVATFKQLLKRSPEDRQASEAGYWCAVMLERQKNPAEAETMYKLALSKSPRADLKPKMQYRLALVLQKQEKFGEAADFLQGLLSAEGADLLDPSLIEWLVRHRWQNEDYGQALPAAKRLTADGVEEKWRQMGWGLLGFSLEKLGKGAEAAQAYSSGLEMESRTPEVVEGALFVGQYHMDQKQYDDATQDFEATAAIASEVGMLDIQARAYFALGEVSERKGNWEDASRFFMSVAVLFDDPKLSPHSLFRAAEAFAKHNKPKEQKQALRELAERYPTSDWAKKASN